MSVQCFIFDLDGVLANTEPLHLYAKEQILKELDLSSDVDLAGHVGKPNQELWVEILREHHLESPSPAELERRQYEIILEQMLQRRIGEIAGVTTLLDALDMQEIKAGVCSSSDRYYVEAVLEILELKNRFTAIVGGDEVASKKPAPDGYLRVLEIMGVTSENAMAIEDSRAGMAAAMAAGIRCIGYINPDSGTQDLSEGMARVQDMVDAIPLLRE